MTMVNLEVTQSLWTLRRDDGSELPGEWATDGVTYPGGATVLPDEEDWPGTHPLRVPSHEQLVGGDALRVRFRLHANFEGTGTVVHGLQVRVNGGSWTTVTTSSTPVSIVGSVHVSNLTATTQWMSTLANFRAGWVLTSQDSASIDWTGESNQNTEIEWCVLIDATLEADDLVEFRVIGDGAELFGYSSTSTYPAYARVVLGNLRPSAPTLIEPAQFEEVHPGKFDWGFNEGLKVPDAQTGYALSRHGVALRATPWRNQTRVVRYPGCAFSPDGQYILVPEHISEPNSSSSIICLRCYNLETGSQVGSRSYSPVWNSFFGYWMHKVVIQMRVAPDSSRVLVRVSGGTAHGDVLAMPSLNILSVGDTGFDGSSANWSHDSSLTANAHASVMARRVLSEDGSTVEHEGLLVYIYPYSHSATAPDELWTLIDGTTSDPWGSGCTRWSPDGSMLAITQNHGMAGHPRLWIYDTTTWQVISGAPTFPHPDPAPVRAENRGLDFSPDGSLLSMEFSNETVVYRTSDWGVQYVFSMFDHALDHAKFTEDGLLVGNVISGWGSNQLRVMAVDPWTGKIIHSVPVPNGTNTGFMDTVGKYMTYRGDSSTAVWLADVHEHLGWDAEWWNADLETWMQDEYINQSPLTETTIPMGGWES